MNHWDTAPAVPDHDQPERHGVRIEDIFRVLIAVAFVGALGFTLGGFTIEELVGRGTGYFIIAICVGVLATALAYYRMEWCLVAFLSFAWITTGATPDLATGVSSGTGKVIFPVEVGLIFLLTVWLIRDLTSREKSFVHLRLNGVLVAYLLYALWSTITGVLFWDVGVSRYYGSENNFGHVPTVVYFIEHGFKWLSVGAFWLVASNLRSARALRWASYMLLLPGTLVLLTNFKLLPIPQNAYSSLLEIVLATTLFSWLLEERDPAARLSSRTKLFWGWVLLLAVVVQLFIVNVSWISAWVGLFVGLGTVAWLKSRRLFWRMVVIGAIGVACFWPLLQTHVVLKVQTSGDLDRFTMARSSLMYATKWPFGIGPGNYRTFNNYYGSFRAWNTTGYTSAHNFYAQALAETGFVGLVLTVVWVVMAFKLLLWIWRGVPAGAPKTILLGLIGMWAGICSCSFMGDYLIPVYYNGGISTLATTVYAWVGLGIAVAYARFYGLLPAATRRDDQGLTEMDIPVTRPDLYPQRLGP